MKTAIIRQPHYVVIRTATDRIALVRDTTSRVVVLAGRQGIPGPAGGSLITGVAAVALGGHRIVTTNASGQYIYADTSILAHAGRAVGMTTGSASAGGVVTIQPSGLITEPGWAWTPGALIYATGSGLIGGSPPATGWLQAIGYAQTPTSIFINLQQTIVR